MARVVDRGPLTGAADVASFEMFGTPVGGGHAQMKRTNKHSHESSEPGPNNCHISLDVNTFALPQALPVRSPEALAGV
eukprot:7396509-Pyramimonas_sp.AAC.3